jgi:hypothetical protein
MSGRCFTGTGSAANPAYTFSADGDTGVYRIGVDSLGISAGGYVGVSVTRASSNMTVDLAGILQAQQSLNSVGIGTTTPGAMLEVKTTTTFAKPCLELDQEDADQPFINYEGTSDAGVGNSITTATILNFDYEGMVRIKINGVDYWMPYYSYAL